MKPPTPKKSGAHALKPLVGMAVCKKCGAAWYGQPLAYLDELRCTNEYPDKDAPCMGRLMLEGNARTRRGRGQPAKEATKGIRAYAADVPRLAKYGKTQAEAVRALLKIK
jgi:hypothetical protein